MEPDYTSVEGYGDEQCDGVDSDCDGSTDEGVEGELADMQAGVCVGSLKRCVDGAWVEPEYALLSGYAVNDSPCDEVDNDCDGRLDEGIADPEVCDGVDNDCDGSTDEEWDPADAPLADVQVGVCEGVKRVCEAGAGWVEPRYSEVSGYGDEVCDGVDSDCDGSTDEDINPADAPLAENQVGVCEGSLQSCVEGDWVSDYAGVSDYETVIEESLSDGADNDCDGDVDEVPPPCFPDCPNFVRIEGGSFMMGSDDEEAYDSEQPVHQVQVSTFWMAESEVTVAQYQRCVDAGVCTEPSIGSEYCTWGKSGYENHPVNCVDWGQARTFSRWVGGDLPTEAQWEYAARGGQSFRYAGSDNPDEVAWYDANAESTREVKTKRPNGYGLYPSGNDLTRCREETPR